MRVKKYLNIDVYEAFQRRMDFIFSEFENVTISFSGGKDSGLVLHLVMDFVERYRIKRRVCLYHNDMEAQYSYTTEYVTAMFERYADRMDPYWWCIPLATRTAMGQQEIFLYIWDDTKPDAWARPRPDFPYVRTLENNPMGKFYRYRMDCKSHGKAFERWYCHTHGGGRTVTLLGLRATESLKRYRSIVAAKHYYKDARWTTRLDDGIFTASPLYDWTTTDVWHCYAENNFPYNRVYDLFHKAGASIYDMRVASPFLEGAASNLHLYRILDPEIWARLLCRAQGANFTAIYGESQAVAYRTISLPEGHTWKSYVEFLLSTLPDHMRQNYIKRFAHLQDDPPWREMAICILKNDHLCNGLAGIRGKLERRQETLARYADL